MMNDKNAYIREIERLNLELINLKNDVVYQSGLGLLKLKKQGIKGIMSAIKRRKAFKNVKQIFVNYNLPLKEQQELARTGKEDIKVVVYTCITGKYDNLVSPYIYPNNIDYILYSDLVDAQGWNHKDIPEKLRKKYNNALINRYIKFHPFELFQDKYDFSIYIDGNITPISDLSVLTELINTEIGIAFHSHCTRNCIYEEVKACQILKKGNLVQLEKQVKRYKGEGFPKEFGMVEGNVIVTDLKNTKAKKLFSECWDELIRSESGRDQMVWPYLFWKKEIEIERICSLGKNVYYNPKLRIKQHS